MMKRMKNLLREAMRYFFLWEWLLSLLRLPVFSKVHNFLFYNTVVRMIDKTQLKQIICDTESHRIERTSSSENSDKFCQAICAFSNDVSGSGKQSFA